MSENNDTERANLQKTKNSPEDVENPVKKTPKRRRRLSGRKGITISGLWPKIAIAAIVLCLILAGVSISMVNKKETAPVIQNVSISDIAQTSAIINWQTNAPATSEITVCRSDNCTLLKLDKSMVINHSATLTDLEPGTRYQLNLVAGNEQNKEARFTLELVTPRVAATPVNIPPEIGHGVGEIAPDFTLPTIDGQQESLSQFRGKNVMLNFWQSSCPACDAETPLIQAVFDEWSGDKLKILAVSVEERDIFVRTFLNTRGLTFPTLLDSDGNVSKIYGSPAFPTTFFINSEGIIKGIKTGHFTSQTEIENMLKSL